MSDTLSTCTNRVMAFFRHLDDRDYEALTALMTQDATWHRQGAILHGHQQVHDALMKRPQHMRIHHLITNLNADRYDEHTCVMRAYMVVVRHQSDTALPGPAPLAGIESIRTTHIDLKRVDAQWFIQTMRNDEPSFLATA